jgi:hypothetical protein
MNKKTIVIIVTGIVSLSLVGCGNKSNKKADVESKPKIQQNEQGKPNDSKADDNNQKDSSKAEEKNNSTLDTGSSVKADGYSEDSNTNISPEEQLMIDTKSLLVDTAWKADTGKYLILFPINPDTDKELRFIFGDNRAKIKGKYEIKIIDGMPNLFLVMDNSSGNASKDGFRYIIDKKSDTNITLISKGTSSEILNCNLTDKTKAIAIVK